MVRLVLMELRRALSRGVTRLLTALGVVALVAIGVLVFFVVRDGDELRAEARAHYDQLVTMCVDRPDAHLYPMGPQTMPDGADIPPATRPVIPGPGTAEARRWCEQMYAPVAARYGGFDLHELWPGPGRLAPAGRIDEALVDLAALLRGIIVLPGLVLMIGGLAAGASMVGAEWQAGSLVTLLTWEPRRTRLLAARMAATAIVGFAIALGLLALFTLTMWVTGAVKGVVPAEGDWWVTYAGIVVRLSGLTALAAVVGVALAMIGKRTALALLVVPVYLIGAEIVLRMRWEAARPWLLVRNLALVLGGAEELSGLGTAPRGLAVLLGWSALIIAVAFAAFTRRDFVSSG
jgi:hypothetical protein